MGWKDLPLWLKFALAFGISFFVIFGIFIVFHMISNRGCGPLIPFLSDSSYGRCFFYFIILGPVVGIVGFSIGIMAGLVASLMVWLRNRRKRNK